eukprot:2223530-Rhodomonas_salina.2
MRVPPGRRAVPSTQQRRDRLVKTGAWCSLSSSATWHVEAKCVGSGGGVACRRWQERNKQASEGTSHLAPRTAVISHGNSPAQPQARGGLACEADISKQAAVMKAWKELASNAHACVGNGGSDDASGRGSAVGSHPRGRGCR